MDDIDDRAGCDLGIDGAEVILDTAFDPQHCKAVHHRPGGEQEIIWIAAGRPALLLGCDGRFPDRLEESPVGRVELRVGSKFYSSN